MSLSALVADVCEQEDPDVDWEKLVAGSGNVYDIYTGMRLDKDEVAKDR